MRNITKDVLSSGANALGETWKYSTAVVEYTGLLSWSYTSRAGCALYTPLSKSAVPVRRAAGATASLFSVNGVGKAYKAAIGGTGKAYKATTGGICKAYDATSKGIGKMFKAIPVPGSRLKRIEESLYRIEDKLTYIAEHGIAVQGEAVQKEEPQKTAIPEEKMMLLRGIIQENIELKNE